MDDVDNVVSLDSDPEVMRFISYGDPTPREAIASRVLPGWMKYYEGDTRTGVWAAELKDADEFIGWFHLRPDRFDEGEQELGYRLKRSVWGQGIATEGSLAVLHDGFVVSKFDKISARTLIGNKASQRVMEKCGLRFEYQFTYPEHILRGGTEEMRRAVKYSVTRDEWLKRQ